MLCLRIYTFTLSLSMRIKLFKSLYLKNIMEKESNIKNGKVALVIGSTGLIGQHLTKLLLENPDFESVKVFVRKKSTLYHPKLKQIVTDFENPDSYREQLSGDYLFCCLGTTRKKAGSKAAFKKVDYDYPVNFARIALENNVKKMMIVTAIGANSQSTFFYSKVKGEVEDSLKLMDFDQLFVFQPSLLLGERKEKRFLENLTAYVLKLSSFALTGFLSKYRPIPAEVVAASMIDKTDIKERGIFVYQSNNI
ncbi:MAG: NAD-dependent epimerase/dehydratase family protein [Chitinophagaceae bacterium]|nr:MAG: NAD-dependent epimerase/dehydratase family protein [Chitinophagaceae bacterium]